MTCDGLAPLLAAAAGDHLDPERRARLDAHLVVCDACRSALADQLTVRSWLAKTPEAEAPARFAERVRARIDESESLLGIADFRRWTLRLAPVAALLALAAWFGFGQSSTPSAPDTRTAVAQTSAFSPSSAADWQRSVSGNALLEAALGPPHAGGGDVR